MCSEFRAPREYEGYEYSEYSGIRRNTVEHVSSRALVGTQEPLLEEDAYSGGGPEKAPLQVEDPREVDGSRHLAAEVRPRCSRGAAEVQPRCSRGRGATEVRPRCSQSRCLAEVRQKCSRSLVEQEGEEVLAEQRAGPDLSLSSFFVIIVRHHSLLVSTPAGAGWRAVRVFSL